MNTSAALVARIDSELATATFVDSHSHIDPFAPSARTLADILGYPPQTHVSIEYIKSLGDWKTAWDHVHFRGFLGTPMTFQFTWQGCDSILAAPLVLDLVRLVERAHRAGEFGALPWLACFFKSPLGVAEQDFSKQFSLLTDWALRTGRAGADTAEREQDGAA